MELPDLVAAYLVAHAVNLLDAFADDSLPSCCPHECGPCGALLWLHENGKLSDAIRPYVIHSEGDWEWWNAENDRFDWKFVEDRWCDSSRCLALFAMAEEDDVSYSEARRRWEIEHRQIGDAHGGA